MVFSHNDLYYLNYLVHEDYKKVTLIDLEFSAMNYKAYDIGYTLISNMFDCDNDDLIIKLENFPTEKETIFHYIYPYWIFTNFQHLLLHDDDDIAELIV